MCGPGVVGVKDPLAQPGSAAPEPGAGSSLPPDRFLRDFSAKLRIIFLARFGYQCLPVILISTLPSGSGSPIWTRTLNSRSNVGRSDLLGPVWNGGLLRGWARGVPPGAAGKDVAETLACRTLASALGLRSVAPGATGDRGGTEWERSQRTHRISSPADTLPREALTVSEST